MQQHFSLLNTRFRFFELLQKRLNSSQRSIPAVGRECTIHLQTCCSRPEPLQSAPSDHGDRELHPYRLENPNTRGNSIIPKRTASSFLSFQLVEWRCACLMGLCVVQLEEQ